MRTIEEIRRARLELLASEFGGLAELARRMGKVDRGSTLSQISGESRGSKTGAPKAMGSKLARELEVACGKDRGWMDNDPALSSGLLSDELMTHLAGLGDDELLKVENSIRGQRGLRHLDHLPGRIAA